MAAALGGVLVAALCGLANGLLITGLRVMPFIVTLGAKGLIRGAAKGLANWVQEIITGVIIIVAVALDRLRHRRGVGS